MWSCALKCSDPEEQQLATFCRLLGKRQAGTRTPPDVATSPCGGMGRMAIVIEDLQCQKLIRLWAGSSGSVGCRLLKRIKRA